MFSIFRFFSKALPDLRAFSLERYNFDFSFDTLTAGVDNVSYDVLLSPQARKAAGHVAYRLITEHSGTDETLGVSHTKGNKDRETFEVVCRDILLDGITKAKAARDVQIDLLAQVAMAKMLVSEIQVQYELLIKRFKSNLWQNETSKGQHHSSTIAFKEKLSEIQQNRTSIFRSVGADLFQFFTGIQRGDLQQMREANFGAEPLLPTDIFANPMIHVEDTTDTLFMIEQ